MPDTSNGNSPTTERDPLLPTSNNGAANGRGLSGDDEDTKARRVVWGLLTLLFIAAGVLLVGFAENLGDAWAPWVGKLPKDPMAAALTILDKAPVIVSAARLLSIVIFNRL